MLRSLTRNVCAASEMEKANGNGWPSASAGFGFVFTTKVSHVWTTVLTTASMRRCRSIGGSQTGEANCGGPRGPSTFAVLSLTRQIGASYSASGHIGHLPLSVKGNCRPEQLSDRLGESLVQTVTFPSLRCKSPRSRSQCHLTRLLTIRDDWMMQVLARRHLWGACAFFRWTMETRRSNGAHRTSVRAPIAAVERVARRATIADSGPCQQRTHLSGAQRAGLPESTAASRAANIAAGLNKNRCATRFVGRVESMALYCMTLSL
jgi:hypothetical protein